MAKHKMQVLARRLDPAGRGVEDVPMPDVFSMGLIVTVGNTTLHISTDQYDANVINIRTIDGVLSLRPAAANSLDVCEVRP